MKRYTECVYFFAILLGIAALKSRHSLKRFEPLHSMRPKATSGDFPKLDIIKLLEARNLDSGLIASIVETSEIAYQSWEGTTSCFLQPPEYEKILSGFNELITGLAISTFGGYPQATRRRILFFRKKTSDVRNPYSKSAQF